MEKEKSVSLKVFGGWMFVMLAIIAVLGLYIVQLKNTDNEQNVENVVDNEVKDEEQEEDIATKCKVVFEKYYEMNQSFAGHTLEGLKVLGLTNSVPSYDTYEGIERDEGYYYKTDIKYSDFENAMLKYMTEKMLKDYLSTDNMFKDVDGYLQLLSAGGTNSKIKILKFVEISTDENRYIYSINADETYSDHPDIYNVDMVVTFEKQKGEYVVASVQYIESTDEENNEVITDSEGIIEIGYNNIYTLVNGKPYIIPVFRSSDINVLPDEDKEYYYKKYEVDNIKSGVKKVNTMPLGMDPSETTYFIMEDGSIRILTSETMKFSSEEVLNSSNNIVELTYEKGIVYGISKNGEKIKIAESIN